jgi:signal transduction histidine kinase/CheY-like chemotaxis protein
MFERLRDRFAAARAGDALELEQALIRPPIFLLCSLYYLARFLSERTLDDRELVTLCLAAAFIAISIVPLAWILWRPGVNNGRRYAAMVIDMVANTTALLREDEIAAVFFFFLLWIIIGNGFRFGRAYLRVAQALALAGFGTTLVFNAYWHQHLTLGVSMLLVLLAIPWYVSLLIGKLHATNERLQQAQLEAEAANLAKTRFFAAASHDLRQPMQALSMYASVLRDRVADASALRVVHGIQLSVTTLEQLFDSLLDISKIESGAVKPALLPFPLMPLIEHVVQLEQPIAAQKNLALRAARTSASVRSDPVLLERMLKNLLTNAIRYTDRGGVVVGCRIGGPGRLLLQVVDTGMGIPEDEQLRVFEEYYQASGAGAQGLGLGLPIVKRLGELLDHRVTLRSRVGRGSVFSIELERAADAAAPAVDRPPLNSLPGNPLVVLVDDDAEIRTSMRLLLESWGCRCVAGATLAEVESGLEALRMRPDAVIADYHLTGGVTGMHIVGSLRTAFGATLPALIVTGTAHASFQENPFAGIPFALKPVPPGKLRAFLAQSVACNATSLTG